MNNTLQTIKEAGQDFEWYPTTIEIMNAVKRHIDDTDSVLDIGAGDGRVLKHLTKGSKYAVEISTKLIEAMPANTVIVGTDFNYTTLIDKKVDTIFCNPPYSDFDAWAVKIIREANADKVFLVLPTRWATSKPIADALKLREARATVILSTDFLNAERQARAKVDVIEIILKEGSYGDRLKTDPFQVWFETEFKPEVKPDNFTASEEARNTWREKIESSVIVGRGIIPAMVELYNAEMGHLHGNYKAVMSLDADIFKILDISIDAISDALKLKIEGLKNKYWEEVFDRLDEITSRLTTKTRKAMLDRLTGHTSVDFNESNIRAVLIWAIKNANNYYNSQLIDVVESLISESNIKNYKSNQRTWDASGWRYNRKPEDLSRYALELRIVREGYSAISGGAGYTWDFVQNLSKPAHDIINDLMVIIKNMGYASHATSFKNMYLDDRDWESNKTEKFIGTDGQIIMEVKAFKNGNLHIKFKKEVICKLNVEFGRLKGWLNTPQEAAEELNIAPELARAAFNGNRQITNNNLVLLTN